MFARALRDVERSRRLASALLKQLRPQQPTLSLAYEDLLSRHEVTVQTIAEFLGLSATPMLRSSGTSSVAPLRKATPDQLCKAVSNYRQFCQAYRNSKYASFFGDDCEASCALASQSHASAQGAVVEANASRNTNPARAHSKHAVSPRAAGHGYTGKQRGGVR